VLADLLCPKKAICDSILDITIEYLRYISHPMSITHPKLETRRTINISKLDTTAATYSAFNVVIVLDNDYEEAEEIKPIATKLNSYFRLQEFCTMEITKEILKLESIAENSGGIQAGLSRMLTDSKLARTL